MQWWKLIEISVLHTELKWHDYPTEEQYYLSTFPYKEVNWQKC